MPSTTPASPPTMDSRNDSMRNCACICPGRAPMAFFRPISTVRSVTEVSIMFMMPMPPTSRAMEAMPPRSADIIESMDSMVSAMDSMVVME